MMNTWEDFVCDLTKIELLRIIKNEAIKDWGEDIPKSLIFSKLGKGVVDKIDDFSPSERGYVFVTIENGMQTMNEDLKTLVATGLLESLYTRASSDVALWERVHNQLGELSKQYLLDWCAWSR
jgi:hypothetical protein